MNTNPAIAAEETAHQKLTRLTESWKHAKQMEQDWNQQRIAIESEIYELAQGQLPEKGTVTLDTGMKISTGFTEEWDQGQLSNAYNQWPVESVKFPFATVYKPDTKAIGVIRDSIPGLYSLLRPALTLKSKKPSFSLNEK